MGASSSRLARARSEAIDRQLKADSLQSKKEVPVLLLGSDHASKSTLVKHIKLLRGLTPEELAAFRSAIHRTVIDSVHGIVLALLTSGLDGMLAEEHRHLPDVILRVKLDNALNSEIAVAIETLWRTPAVVRLLDDNEDEVYLPDSAVYFFTQIQHLAQPEYTPTEEDVLRTPAQKNTITETRFSMGGLSIRFIDVGPLRSERKKWIHCFESCNRMRESLYLFESIINSRWFLRTSIILFFTEVDAFEAKIRKIPLARYFPEYTGGPDVIKAAKYFLWCFMQENRARLSVYPQCVFACFLFLLLPLISGSFSVPVVLFISLLSLPFLIGTNDTKCVRLVFAAIKETIIQNALKNCKILDTQVL
ncbi:Heterotrimeric G-protein alpha subunit [Mycena sanguinolenta]|uniref:Heterotrimeric G-protein alpha subunit n=1 Tax=Mycena sanguinolenta TaxID=230812 RepID=A0A8H6X4C8_9AGAR|nr:Heterotrimeric G-protein alpha subunit [Mycena sanguinolenta]